MSSLADFVSEHRSKTTRTSFNVANIGTKVSNSFNGFFKVNETEDCETLTDNPSTSGQLPYSRNRYIFFYKKLLFCLDIVQKRNFFI